MSMDKWNVLDDLVRMVVTLALVGALIWGFVVAKSVNADTFIGIAGLAIGFWFNGKGNNGNGNGTPPPAAK